MPLTAAALTKLARMSSLKFNAIVANAMHALELGDFADEHLHVFMMDRTQDATAFAFMKRRFREAMAEWVTSRRNRASQIQSFREFLGDDAIERAMEIPAFEIPFDAARVAGREALLRETSLPTALARQISHQMGDVLPKAHRTGGARRKGA